MTTKDKRIHPRADSLNLISYVCIDENNNEVTQGMGRTLNVSEGGILLETHVEIEQQCTVELAIGLENEMINIKGKVVFPKPGKEEKFETGIQFLDMDKKTRRTLGKYIKAFKEQKKNLESIGLKIS